MAPIRAGLFVALCRFRWIVIKRSEDAGAGLLPCLFNLLRELFLDRGAIGSALALLHTYSGTRIGVPRNRSAQIDANVRQRRPDTELTRSRRLSFPLRRMRLRIISPLWRTIDLMRVRDGDLPHQYRSQSPELLPSPSSICQACARSAPFVPPPTPPFSLHPHETEDVRPIMDHLCPSKQRTYLLPVFASFQKQSTHSEKSGPASRSRNPVPNPPRHTNSGFGLGSTNGAW